MQTPNAYYIATYHKRITTAKGLEFEPIGFEISVVILIICTRYGAQHDIVISGDLFSTGAVINAENVLTSVMLITLQSGISKHLIKPTRRNYLCK